MFSTYYHAEEENEDNKYYYLKEGIFEPYIFLSHFIMNF